MTPFLLALAATLLATGLFSRRRGAGVGDPARDRRVIAEVASLLGFDTIDDRWWRDDRAAVGAVRGVQVRAEVVTRTTQLGRDRSARVQAFGVPTHLDVRGKVLALLDRTGIADVRTGDTEFDDAVLVGGDALFIRSRLDRDARAALRALVRAGGQVRGGVVEIESAGCPPVHELLRHVEVAVDVAARLAAVPGTESHGLRGLALNDPNPGVRRTALETLRTLDARVFADTAHRALRDRSARVRAYAGAALGDTAVLRRVLASTTDEDALTTVLVAVRARAVADTEPSIVPLLQHPAGSVRLAAALALEVVGGGPSIGPLRRVADTLLERGDIREAARAAGVAIVGRVGPLAEGRVSLARVAGDGSVGLVTGVRAGDVEIVPPPGEGEVE